MRTWTAFKQVDAAPDAVLAALTSTDACRRWSPVPFELDDEAGRLSAGARVRVSGQLVGRARRVRRRRPRGRRRPAGPDGQRPRGHGRRLRGASERRAAARSRPRCPSAAAAVCSAAWPSRPPPPCFKPGPSASRWIASRSPSPPDRSPRKGTPRMTALSLDARAATAVAVAATAVTRRYGDGESAVDALRGVSLEVPAGQFTAVMGPSGSGKSTLMHLLAGLDRPTAGSVHIAGEEISSMPDRRLTKLRRRAHRLRLPVVQPAPDPHGGGEHHAPARDRPRQAGARGPRRADRARRARGPARPQAGRAVRRPAAARRDRPGADRQADGAVRRRADRQPGLRRRHRRARAAARRRRARRPDDR